MKDIFPDHYPISETDLKSWWSEGVFVFDANILLEVYRYSLTAKTEFIKFLSDRKESIWIPHQFALEYQQNRQKVITEQLVRRRELWGWIHESVRHIENERLRLPSEKQDRILTKLKAALDSATKELEEAEKEIDWYIADPIRTEFDVLFEGRVGSPYSTEQLEDKKKEGKYRMSIQTPPGFRDKRPGDFLGWKQMMEYAKGINKPIIFVTNDSKDDWWEIGLGGYKIGPRIELKREIKKEANVNFVMYTLESFLVEAGKNGASISQGTIEEIKVLGRDSDTIVTNEDSQNDADLSSGSSAIKETENIQTPHSASSSMRNEDAQEVNP